MLELEASAPLLLGGAGPCKKEEEARFGRRGSRGWTGRVSKWGRVRPCWDGGERNKAGMWGEERSWGTGTCAREGDAAVLLGVRNRGDRAYRGEWGLGTRPRSGGRWREAGGGVC